MILAIVAGVFLAGGFLKINSLERRLLGCFHMYLGGAFLAMMVLLGLKVSIKTGFLILFIYLIVLSVPFSRMLSKK